ncbi:hypothetical protein AB205_0118170, partial [Aquarana catesbeiana]
PDRTQAIILLSSFHASFHACLQAVALVLGQEVEEVEVEMEDGPTHTGEKRLGTSKDTRDPQTPKEGEIPTPQPEDVEEGEVYELGEIVTTTGYVDVVEEETHFTRASAHILIGEMMVCNRDLQKIKEDINDVEKRLKNIIDVLGRI